VVGAFGVRECLVDDLCQDFRSVHDSGRSLARHGTDALSHRRISTGTQFPHDIPYRRSD
jgi:hypothetical protein